MLGFIKSEVPCGGSKQSLTLIFGKQKGFEPLPAGPILEVSPT
jgi:hypothetical protein